MKIRFIISSIICLFYSVISVAEVSVSTLLSSHMVLQRGEEFIIKGQSTIEKTVKIQFDGKTRNIICKNGKWSITFSPKEAGGPYIIDILGENAIHIEDIYFGDVYLCSGQSNMEWPTRAVINADRELKDANYPMIRHFTVTRDLNSQKKETLMTGEWELSTPVTVSGFSAIGFLFGRALYKEHGIPIGLIDNSWGGSEIDPYMDEVCFHDKEDYLLSIEKFKNSNINLEESNALLSKWNDGLSNADIGMSKQWQKPKTNRSDWEVTSLPGNWESNIWPGYDGIGWYAKEFYLEDVPQGNVTINLCKIDDGDNTYINGVEVGSMDYSHDKVRAYIVDNGVFRKGKNEIVIRMIDYTGGGGLSGNSEDLNIDLGIKKIDLSGTWRAKKGTDEYEKPKGILNQNTYPSSKYNAMVHPLVNIKLSGILWYQGESDWNATRDYAWKAIRMITDYRAKWDQPRLPFMFVQLANWTAELDDPAPANWGEIRESQDMSLSLSHTALITAIDIGEAEDIHPRNKQTVAARFVKAANNLIYDKQVEYRNPRIKNARLTKDGYLIEFENVDKGLKLKDGYRSVSGMTILLNGKMTKIDSEIFSKDKVLIRLENPKPTMIRYLWADNPGDITLYSSGDLPALPFQIFAERQ